MEVEVREKVPTVEIRDINKKGDYFMICFMKPLRRSEWFMMYGVGLRYHIRK